MTRVLVTGAGGSATANFIDALRRGDAATHVVGADASPVRLHLSRADDRVLLPFARDEGWVASLDRACRRYGIDFIHCQPDPEVLALGRARHALSARTFLPSQQALEIAADKQAFARVMQCAGVAVPESAEFATNSELRHAVGSLLERHPRVWVRARVGAGSRASLPVSCPEQAAHWIDWWIAEKGMQLEDFMAAECLPGREFAYQSLWQDGRFVAGQARERVEYLYGHLTPHGQTSTPAVARTVKLPAIDELAIAAIRALDDIPHGVYGVDLKEDAAGHVKVTEINAGRFFTTSNFFATAGLNMPDMFVRLAMGEKVASHSSSPLEPDLYWLRMVDMGHVLVTREELDAWPRANP